MKTMRAPTKKRIPRRFPSSRIEVLTAYTICVIAICITHRSGNACAFGVSAAEENDTRSLQQRGQQQLKLKGQDTSGIARTPQASNRKQHQQNQEGSDLAEVSLDTAQKQRLKELNINALTHTRKQQNGGGVAQQNRIKTASGNTRNGGNVNTKMNRGNGGSNNNKQRYGSGGGGGGQNYKQSNGGSGGNQGGRNKNNGGGNTNRKKQQNNSGGNMNRKKQGNRNNGGYRKKQGANNRYGGNNNNGAKKRNSGGNNNGRYRTKQGGPKWVSTGNHHNSWSGGDSWSSPDSWSAPSWSSHDSWTARSGKAGKQVTLSGYGAKSGKPHSSGGEDGWESSSGDDWEGGHGWMERDSWDGDSWRPSSRDNWLGGGWIEKIEAYYPTYTPTTANPTMFPTLQPTLLP